MVELRSWKAESLGKDPRDVSFSKALKFLEQHLGTITLSTRKYRGTASQWFYLMRIHLYVNEGEIRENKNEQIKQVILFSISAMDVYPSTQRKCDKKRMFLWSALVSTRFS